MPTCHKCMKNATHFEGAICNQCGRKRDDAQAHQREREELARELWIYCGDTYEPIDAFKLADAFLEERDRQRQGGK